MHDIVRVIIVGIVIIQLFFFFRNLSRMFQFGRIFSESETWRIRRIAATNLVDGIYGKGNSIFDAIVDSINKYLGNNSGSVIDFGLLKDAVDRHSDYVENDIAAQIPIPLYWGLAGTMAGVILGLWDLLDSNAIVTLMSSGTGQIDASAQSAARGIDSLLGGVALAMCASVMGIILTTLNSIFFKRFKLKEETGKNSFLAWMQSVLLPELPSDTSQALTNLVRNLNEFNSTFERNTANLGTALNAVNQSYAIQAGILKSVHDMDVMKMAKANVGVLKELQECTKKLENFNEYLQSIEGYTEAIHRFEAQFNQQAERMHVLEEIRDFFGRHKSEIAKTTADADRTLQESLRTIRESTAENVGQMNKQFVEFSESFKKIINDEKESFESFITQINAQFSAQMERLPQLNTQFEIIADIPVRIDCLIEKVEKSNQRLASDLALALKENLIRNYDAVQTNPGYENWSPVYSEDDSSVSTWMKWIGLVALIIIALACLFNIACVYFPEIKPENQQPVVVETSQAADEPTLLEDSSSHQRQTVQDSTENISSEPAVAVQDSVPAN